MSLYTLLVLPPCMGIFCWLAAAEIYGYSRLNLASVIASFATLLGLGAISLWLRRWWAAAWCGLTTAACVLAMPISIRDGWPTVPAQLTLLGCESVGSRQVNVFWVRSGNHGWQRVAWSPSGQSDASSREFTSIAELIITEKSNLFFSSCGWHVWLDAPVVVRVGDEKEFVFSSSEVFGTSHSGLHPATIAGSIDMGEYFRGRKRARSLLDFEVVEAP